VRLLLEKFTIVLEEFTIVVERCVNIKVKVFLQLKMEKCECCGVSANDPVGTVRCLECPPMNWDHITDEQMLEYITEHENWYLTLTSFPPRWKTVQVDSTNLYDMFMDRLHIEIIKCQFKGAQGLKYT
jgi:hypothetical protein